MTTIADLKLLFQDLLDTTPILMDRTHIVYSKNPIFSIKINSSPMEWGGGMHDHYILIEAEK